MKLLFLPLLVGDWALTGFGVKVPATLGSDLDAVRDEEAARAVLKPYMEDLKELHGDIVEKVVLRQWWGVAQDIVLASHVQRVDFSFSVRKAVRALKDEADELLRTLNPKYGEAQLVNPAFQWAQNDTCIFLTIKYTVRWNAPGALEVTDPTVDIAGNWFNFTGLGKHSNNKYRYLLSLPLFDLISTQHSTWTAASVGKLSVTLRKNIPRKWPRLLGSKKTKIGNMHVWMEMQEKLDSSLVGMSSVSQSPVTCLESEKLYCVPMDSCKKAENCSHCPGKEVAMPGAGMCEGIPSAEASLSFADSDLHKGKLGGDVTISKAKTEYDIVVYRVYFGKDNRNKWEDESGKTHLLGEAEPGFNVAVKIPTGTALPPGATHLLVFSSNAHGEQPNPGYLAIKDATLPKGKPEGISFVDEDPDKGEMRGQVTVIKASKEEDVTHYTIYWGKSPTKKLNVSWLAEIVAANFIDRQDVTYHMPQDMKIPDGATHMLVFSKNEFGELPQPVSLKIVDNTKPCLEKMELDCVHGVTVTPDQDPDAGQVQTTIRIEPATQAMDLTLYKVYWGKRGCEGEDSKNFKNGHIRDVDANGSLTISLDVDTFVPPETTHILVFSANKFGESDFCVSISFEDFGAATAKPEL